MTSLCHTFYSEGTRLSKKNLSALQSQCNMLLKSHQNSQSQTCRIHLEPKVKIEIRIVKHKCTASWCYNHKCSSLCTKINFIFYDIQVYIENHDLWHFEVKSILGSTLPTRCSSRSRAVPNTVTMHRHCILLHVLLALYSNWVMGLFSTRTLPELNLHVLSMLTYDFFRIL